ncbi:TonB-dependent receptor [bacterium]|nr:TonB-dependent receptor [bacterium]
MNSLIALLIIAQAWANELPRQYITDTPWMDEFSDRTTHSPFEKLTPQPLQITSPYFEHLFLGSTAVQSRSQGSPTTSIRGSSQAARVLFLLDNIPLNFLDGFGGSTQFVPTEILQQINIFEGPTSALYGANALGGSVHFVAGKKADRLLRISSSQTDSNAALVIPLIHSENNTLQASAFLENNDGDFSFTQANGQNAFRQNNDQQLQRFTLLGKHLTKNWKLSHLLLYSDLRKTSPGSLPMPLVTDQKSKALLAGVSSEYKTSTSTLWTSRFSYASLHSDFLDTTESTSNSDKLWLSQTFSWELAPGILSQTLFDLNHNFYTASFVQNENFERSEPELAQSFIFPFSSRIFFEPSLRYLFRYEQALFQMNIPVIFESSRLWFLYSEGFRPPSLTDLYAQTSYFRGNPLLQPEKSRQFEVGQAWNVEALTFSSSLFFLKYQDLLQSSVLPTSEFTKINVGEAQTYGMSAKIDLQQPRWKAHLSHTYMIARETNTRAPLRFSPEHQTFMSFSSQIKKSHEITLQQSLWSAIWDLDFINNRNTKLAPWSSTDVLYSYKWNNSLSIQAGVYNLFDQRRELSFGYPEPQRRAALAAEMKF